MAGALAPRDGLSVRGQLAADRPRTALSKNAPKRALINPRARATLATDRPRVSHSNHSTLRSSRSKQGAGQQQLQRHRQEGAG